MTKVIPVAQHEPERIAEKVNPAARAEDEEVDVSGDDERGRRGRRRQMVHSQVRRIREEDLRIGDGAGEGLRGVGAAVVVQLGASVGDAAILCSRPWMRTCSPLGNKAAVA